MDEILYKTPKEEEDMSFLMDGEFKKEQLDQKPFSEWIVEEYKTFGCSLEFVTDKSQEGNQFVKGFGGVGGLLRYKVDFQEIADYDNVDEGDSDDEWI